MSNYFVQEECSEIAIVVLNTDAISNKIKDNSEKNFPHSCILSFLGSNFVFKSTPTILYPKSFFP